VPILFFFQEEPNAEHLVVIGQGGDSVALGSLVLECAVPGALGHWSEATGSEGDGVTGVAQSEGSEMAVGGSDGAR
jgi:hypothetical protein